MKEEYGEFDPLYIYNIGQRKRTPRHVGGVPPKHIIEKGDDCTEVVLVYPITPGNFVR